MHVGLVETGLGKNGKVFLEFGVSVLANAGVVKLVARQQALISTGGQTSKRSKHQTMWR